MDTIAVILVGVGAYLMYYSVRGSGPAGSKDFISPVAHVQSSLKTLTGASPAPTITVPTLTSPF